MATEVSMAALEKLWAFAKEAQLNKDDVKNKLLLAKDMNGSTAWHQAAIGGRVEALETLWKLSKEAELNPDELLLAQSEEGDSSLHLEADLKHVEILKKLKVWSK
jgi:ankyrin repeat protein